MRVTAMVPVETVVKILCDVCGREAGPECGQPEFGTLSAQWGYGSSHDGESYRVDLCEKCFFGVLADIKRSRGEEALTSDDGGGKDFGLVSRVS